MIIPVTAFEYGLGPGVMIESDPKLDRNTYDDVGLILQALRNIRIGAQTARQYAEDVHPGIEVPEDLGHAEDPTEPDDEDMPEGYLAPHEVIDIHNELQEIARQTDDARWWFPTLRQLGTPLSDLEPAEQPAANDVMGLVKMLEEDADRFRDVAGVLLKALETSEVAYDEYRGAQE